MVSRSNRPDCFSCLITGEALHQVTSLARRSGNDYVVPSILELIKSDIVGSTINWILIVINQGGISSRLPLRLICFHRTVMTDPLRIKTKQKLIAAVHRNSLGSQRGRRAILYRSVTNINNRNHSKNI